MLAILWYPTQTATSQPHGFQNLLEVTIGWTIVVLIIVIVWSFRKRFVKFWPWLGAVVKQPDSPSKGMSFEQFRSYIMNMHWRDFELYIGNILRKMNFQDVDITPASRDHGIDVKAHKQDELGVESDYIIQCKLYQSSRVGEPDITQLFGDMHLVNPHPKGIVVSPSGFTKGAQDLAQRCGIALWDIYFLYELYKRSL
ncbi:MAG: restriction endonuclease [Chloroflexi bacterium]|nr:restriction endonuclease [Chloroflexota bacterium]